MEDYMPRLTKESLVNIGNKEVKVEDLLKTIIYLPAIQVKSFFMELGLTIPRELRMYVLRETLREKVIETRKSRLTLADELNYRLSWFAEYTETQLENLLIFFDDPKLDREFLEDFWKDLIGYMVEKQVNPKDLKKLQDQSINHVKAVGLELPNMKTYNREIKDLFFDSFGRIDGLQPTKFRPVLYKSSTLSEIRDLGFKYDVDVPRRLKKTELADIIIKELKDRGQHTDDLETQVRGMSVLVMQRFAIDHDIKASTELKKEEIIEYILANAKETKEAYFVPESQEVYNQEIEQVSKQAPVAPVTEKVLEVEEEVLVEEVKEEAVVEEEIKPVIEEVKEEVKYVERFETKYVQQNIDISELVLEIKRLREVVENIQINQNSQPEFIEEQATDELKGEVEPVILNSAEFYGKPKSLKQIIKKDEADEREKFIEDRKAQSSIGTNEQDKDDKAPGEVVFFAKVFKGLGKFLWKLLKVLLKIALIVAAIGIVLLVIYSALTFFISIPFLDGFTNTLDGLISFNGKGLIENLHDIIASITGRTPA